MKEGLGASHEWGGEGLGRPKTKHENEFGCFSRLARIIYKK